MTEENKSSNTNTIIINITCLIIGGLIVYYLLKPKISVASLQPINISSQIENRLDNIEQRLQQLNLQNNQTQSPPTQSNQQQTTYNNSEKTNFILNKDGDIVGMETIRNAKIG